ncbi:CLUMA_CG007528, isoform A [Clunio marinus]|uniref:CLUMA_CG007528, isoform A n=1 Tax=Clunio marinus TaxID=568069 RepID=A0A1J1I1C3_9DIPT|nr:CLUMA_CG007528, isoform A [Clunio marinus]
MESGIISQQNTVYVLNANYKYRSADMLNFFLTPTAMKSENDMLTTMQTKIPQTVVERSKETFNDRTRKSLLKINLFIKRLKWFNIFADTTTSKVKKPTDITQKCSKFLSAKKSLSTKEMYREAAKLLGIDCSLSSSCRCCECQSHYFDYCDDTTEQIEDTDDSSDDAGSDSESYSSELNDPDHYITNCYLIHTETLCECCQMQGGEQNLPTSPFTDIAYNDMSFNHNFLT